MKEKRGKSYTYQTKLHVLMSKWLWQIVRGWRHQLTHFEQLFLNDFKWCFTMSYSLFWMRLSSFYNLIGGTFLFFLIIMIILVHADFLTWLCFGVHCTVCLHCFARVSISCVHHENTCLFVCVSNCRSKYISFIQE